MNIDIVFVYYKGSLNPFYFLRWILGIYGLAGTSVVVDNSCTLELKNEIIVKGSNKVHDFSGYTEGLKYLASVKSKSTYTIFINDSADAHRFFWLSLVLCINNTIRELKKVKGFGACLIGESSPLSFNSVIHCQEISTCFSSYLFFAKSSFANSFFKKYVLIVDEDTILCGGRIISASNMVADGYLENLNGYLGLSKEGSLGRWRHQSTNDTAILLIKAKCLILERLLPSYAVNTDGEFKCFYQSRLPKLLRSLESRLFFWYYK